MVSKRKSTDEDEAEVKIDFKKIKNFFTNKRLFNNYVLIVVLLVVAVFFSVYFRAYSASLPVTEEWAMNTAMNSIRNNIASQINQQYPNLPQPNKYQLIDQQLEKVLQ